MEQEATYVGIDVAKAQVDVAVRPTDERWQVSHDDAGIRQLISKLKTLEPVMVLLEASGGLELPLVAALAAEAVPVVVVNPRQVRDFARATGKLAKTDSLDAAAIAHFAEAVRPPVRPLRDAETQALNSLGCPKAPGDDHAGLGEEPPRHRHRRRPSPHRSPRCMAGAGVVRPGQASASDSAPESRVAGRRTTFCAPSPAWASSSPSLFWPTCRSWAPWIAGRLPPWWEWLPTTGIAAPCVVNAPSGADAPGSAPPCTWEHWWPAATIPSSETSTSGQQPLVSRRNWPSQPACASCSLSSTPCSSIARLGTT